MQAQLGRPLFLSDAAHSFGATYAGQPVGRQADITGFSFHAVKNLTTAEGGALAFSLPDSFDMEAVLGWFKAMALNQPRTASMSNESGRLNASAPPSAVVRFLTAWKLKPVMSAWRPTGWPA